MLKYNQLNKHQKEFIANGCGGKGGWINPPEFLFHTSCNHHDFRYWRGCTEEDRKKTDEEFYKWMKKDIQEYKLSFFKILHYKLWAWTYYKAVRFAGKKFFYYASKQKTMEDLVREMHTESVR